MFFESPAAVFWLTMVQITRILPSVAALDQGSRSLADMISSVMRMTVCLFFPCLGSGCDLLSQAQIRLSPTPILSTSALGMEHTLRYAPSLAIYDLSR